MKKILGIFLKLTLKGGFEWHEVEWEVKETEQLYIMSRQEEGEKKPFVRRLYKEDLMRVNTLVHTSTSEIGYSVRCFEEQREQARENLMAAVKKTALRHYEESERLARYFETDEKIAML